MLSLLLFACSWLPRDPDVVFVSIDTLRYDHLGAYGYPRNTSPFIDSLAAGGVRFEHARSPSSWTLPAHTSMFTGQLSTTHGVVESDLRLPDTVPVLPELFAARGYDTAAAVGTLFLSSMYGFHRGFGQFEDYGVHDKKENLQGLTDTAKIVDSLVSFVANTPPQKPIFLFLHTYDAHYAYDPPPPYDTLFDREPQPTDPRYRSYAYFKKHPMTPAALRHQVAQYDESIRYIDDQLARLDRALRAAGRNPRWVITSDHGEEFGERGSWGHGHTLYAEQLRVPLIVSGPAIPQGKVIKEPVGTHDLAPTLASWIGSGQQLQRPDGVNLTPYFFGAVPPPVRAFLAETSRHITTRLSLYERGERLEWDVYADRTEVFRDEKEEHPMVDGSADRLKARLIELYGRRWLTSKPGVVKIRSNRGVVLGSGRHSSLHAGQDFAVYPPDAELIFRYDGTKSPRMSAAGDLPVVPPLRLKTGTRPIALHLDRGDQSALESLGYVQKDESNSE